MSPSPDVAAYTGLTLLDVTAQDLIDGAIARLAGTWPDWTPREGNTEVVLLEQLAALAESVVYSINQLPDGMTEVLLRLFDLERAAGAAPTASATFTVLDDTGYTIPAGTLVRLDRGSDLEAVDFTTDTDLVIAPGDTEGTVAVTGTTIGVLGNGTASGTTLDLLDGIGYVDAVELATAVGGGLAGEDGAAFLSRALPELSRLTTTIVRPQDFEAYVTVHYPSIARVKTLDLYNPAGAGVPGDDPGYVTVAVATAGGGAVSAPTKAAVEAALIAAAHAGLIITVVDADVTEVDVEVTVLRRGGFTSLAVENSVRAALEDYLNPDTWEWSRLVRVNELIAVVDRAAGVDTVLSVDTPAADLELTGDAPLAGTGTITVNVETP